MSMHEKMDSFSFLFFPIKVLSQWYLDYKEHDDQITNSYKSRYERMKFYI
jgi:hypothetical protein